MDDTYFHRVNRILSCHINALSPAQGKQLKDLIERKVKAYAEPKTKVEPRGASGDKGASV